MIGVIRKRSCLRIVISFFVIIAMTTTILAKPVQATVTTSGFTLDLTDLSSPMPIACYAKAVGEANFIDVPEGIPSGTTIYIADDILGCTGRHEYRAFYKGRAYWINSKNVADLKSTTTPEYRQVRFGKDVKVQKTVVAGNVMDPYHYFYVYAKPSATVKNCCGAVAAGETIEVYKEKYNAKWAKILWKTPNGHLIFGYIQRSYLNSADSYLAGASRSDQQYIKLAKKAKLTYSGILKNYSKEITRAEFCRLAVNWYKATGHTLPKQSKKSPYSDTKDSYVIMAHQLGIIKSTSNKKFYPKKKIKAAAYNSQMKKLVSLAKGSQKVYTSGIVYADPRNKDMTIQRDEAILAFYRAYKATQKKDYLTTGVEYIISPADNPNVCLDVWEWSQSSGAEIGLYEKKGEKNQIFLFYNVNGFSVLYNKDTLKRLTGTTKKVYQDGNGFNCQKITIEYNNDGTVCIKNGDGLYLDIKGGEAVSGAHLVYAKKSGESSQKFVFN